MTTELSHGKIETVVQKIVTLHKQKSGATVNIEADSLTGQKLYAVGVFTEVSRTFAARDLPEKIALSFVKGNVELLKNPNCAVGTWFENGISYLDISVIVADKSLAIKLGNEFNQIAIYDLFEENTIWLDGDGTTPPDKRNLTNSEILDAVLKQIQE